MRKRRQAISHHGTASRKGGTEFFRAAAASRSASFVGVPGDCARSDGCELFSLGFREVWRRRILARIVEPRPFEKPWIRRDRANRQGHESDGARSIGVKLCGGSGHKPGHGLGLGARYTAGKFETELHLATGGLVRL